MTRIGMILGGKYEILKKIGQGGMSVVYLAMDLRLNKQWAVKEMKQNVYQSTDDILKNLQTEAYVLKMVDHPVLPRIVDVIECNHTIYVVMDYIEGRPLSEVLKVKGAQPQDMVIQWAVDLCDALEYLHSMSPPIIYRDMKPSNIMLKPDGRVKLIDFGTAKELCVRNVVDTTALGTRGYAAPEQFGDIYGRGIYKTDERTDIYSLGATLYHMVTGRNPSEPPYGMKTIRQWNPALSSGLEKIIAKCTMADPDERYQTCVELKYALEHYEELEDAFKKNCLHKMRRFLISLTMTLFCGVITLFGYIGKEREKRLDYENLIREGYTYIAQGEYEEAVRVYMSAITDVDGSRSTAYIELIDVYVEYLDDAQTGLKRVAYYINQKHGNIHRNQELLFYVAMQYFDVVKDYKTSAYYFGMLDSKKYEVAEFYTDIARAMSTLDVGNDELKDKLIQFELYNDMEPPSLKKLMNNRLLALTYIRNISNMENAAYDLIRVATKGLKALEEYGEDKVKADYYVAYNQYLSQAYEYAGDRNRDTNLEEMKNYYNEAIQCCDFILGMISADSGKTMECVTDYRLREAKYCQKAELYIKLGNYEKACEIYEEAEQEYGMNSISVYTDHLMLHCKMEEEKHVDVELWDYDSIYAIYKKAKNVVGIEDDYRWKQIKIKLTPLFEKKGD